ITADCSTKQIYSAKSLCDVAGHYSRPDVFQLSVNRAPHRRVVEMQEHECETVESEENTDSCT
ncbi:MAG: hypothetical protein MIO92_14890, partial [Methanosarcinaceae archaeon]|nr:hypothetical protein [Methanosarcinaceae archaeon]